MLVGIKTKYLKAILKYIVIFIILLCVLFLLLVVVSKIPRSYIEKNIKESVNFFKKNTGIEELQKRREYTYVHYYADSMILNIIYCIDTDHPVKSVMWANYYETVRMDTNYDFINLVEKQASPNEQYIRYWHGSMLIIRPLLTIFNIEQIYLINKLIIYLLAIVLFILLFRRSKKVAIIYLISMIMVAFPIVPFCLEYSWTFYIMLITSIIAILIEKNGDKGIYNLFFITGMLTCFFDFLSTEIITLYVPLLLVLAIRKEENRLSNFKDGFIFFLKASILWGISYVVMWFAKWILASIILNINAIYYVKDNAILRINGLQGLDSKAQMYFEALYRNIHNLYPVNIIKNTLKFWQTIGVFFTIILASIDWKNIKKKWFSLLMVIIGIMPYMRYLLLANHSYRHAFFTFREQVITLIALGLFIIDSFNYKLWIKPIKIKK